VEDPQVTTFQVSSASDPSQAEAGLGTKDGRGAADHDQPYAFGRRPRADAPFPFRAHEYGRLLALRGCVADGLRGSDDLDAVGLELLSPPSAGDATSRSTSLCYSCASCGALVPGAQQPGQEVNCPRCAVEGDRDRVARAILCTAGVLS
jgi:hypothetical protein